MCFGIKLRLVLLSHEVGDCFHRCNRELRRELADIVQRAVQRPFRMFDLAQCHASFAEEYEKPAWRETV